MFPVRTPLPPEGSTLRYASLAHLALEALPEWPSPAARALWARVSTCQVFWTGELADGLRPVSAEGGGFVIEEGALETSRPEFKFAVDAKGMLKSSEKSYLYFDVDDRFASETGGSVEIEAQYLDDGDEAFSFEYRGTSGEIMAAPPIPRGASGNWRSATFSLTDAASTMTSTAAPISGSAPARGAGLHGGQSAASSAARLRASGVVVSPRLVAARNSGPTHRRKHTRGMFGVFSTPIETDIETGCLPAPKAKRNRSGGQAS